MMEPNKDVDDMSDEELIQAVKEKVKARLAKWEILTKEQQEETAELMVKVSLVAHADEFVDIFLKTCREEAAKARTLNESPGGTPDVGD